MELVNPMSLAQTLDNINEALFFGRKLSKKDKLDAAMWITSRHDLDNPKKVMKNDVYKYANMYAPTELDFLEGATLFLGDRVTTGAATAHILGEEALRAIKLLDVDNKDVKRAFNEAREGMTARLSPIGLTHGRSGMYCCGKCSSSLYRNLAAGGIEEFREQRLEEGVTAIKRARAGTGKWYWFPFWHTALALSEIDSPSAHEELKYAAPALERSLKVNKEENKYDVRRAELSKKVLNKYVV